MTDNKIKHIVAMVAWGALNAYYLAFHFSWNNFIFFAIMSLYVCCTTVLGSKHNTTQVVETLGNLIGASFALFLGYYLLTLVLPFLKVTDYTDLQHWFNIVLNRFEMIIRRSRFNTTVVEGERFIVVAAIVILIGGKFVKIPSLNIVSRYLWIACIFGTLLYKNYKSPEILFLYAAITFLFIACDILVYKHNESKAKAGKRWYLLLNLLLLFALMVNPNALFPFTQEGYLEYYFLISGLKWYTALYILVVLLLTEFFMIGLCETTEIKTQTDIFVFWNAICALLTVFFLSRFHVGYWWLIALLYGIGFVVAITNMNPTVTQGKEKLDGLEYKYTTVISAAAIISAIAGHFGCLLIAWTLLFGSTLVVYRFRRLKKEDSWKKDAVFYTIVLAVIGATAATALWSLNRHVENYYVLLGLLVVCAAYVWIISNDSGLFVKRGQFLQTVAVAVFAILCLSLCVKGSAKIKVDTNDRGELSVDVTAKQEDRVIESVEYYWLEDYLLLDDSRDDFPKERRITARIPKQDGRLRVIATDNFGVKTEKIYWAHTCQYMGEEK